MKLGFVGLGAMGRPMALNLMARGHTMAVYARRAATLPPLVERGAIAYPSPAAVAAACEALFLMVTATSDVEEVLFGACGAADGARPGTLVIVMSTIAPDAARAFAARLAAGGVDLLDAPVSGGPQGAQDATLAIMVGGRPELFERALPLFRSLGSTITLMGGHGAGQATKACNQIAQLVAAQGVAEALTFASRYGLDPAQVREVLLGGLASSRVLEVFGRRMIERRFDAGIDARLYHKDLQIVLDVAKTTGCALPASALTMQLITALVDAGGGHSDLSALITILEQLRPDACVADPAVTAHSQTCP